MEAFILKKITAWFLAFALILTFAFAPAGASANSSIKLVVDGQEMKFDAQPKVENGRALIPLRGLFEKAGLRVDWNAASKTATVTNGLTTIVLKENNKQAQVNGKTVTLDVAAKTHNGRMYIPTRFIAETVGFNVDYKANTVNIKTNLVKDAVAFLEKTMQTDLNSYSANMKIDQTMKMSSVFDSELKMSMNINLDAIHDPFAMYMKLAMKMSMDGESESIPGIESYVTKDGFYQYDPMEEVWVKYDDGSMVEMIEELMLQADPLAMMDEMKQYLKDIYVYEYADHYVMSYSLSDTFFNEMLGGLGDILGEEMGDLPIKIGYFQFATKYDKKTLYPLELAGKAHMYGDIEGEKLNLYQSFSGTYSKFNEIKEIKIPQEVLSNAVNFSDLYPELDW